jgi:hypothetical protein
MEMPRPTAEHRKLQLLLGDWEGEERMAPSPWGPGGPAKGRYKGRDLDGFWVIQEYEQEIGGAISFRGHGVFGWDPQAKEYTWYWVDSMGSVPAAPSRGTWEGDTLTFRSTSAQGEGRYVYRFEGERTYHFRLESSFDGGKSFVAVMEGTYRRR